MQIFEPLLKFYYVAKVLGVESFESKMVAFSVFSNIWKIVRCACVWKRYLSKILLVRN